MFRDTDEFKQLIETYSADAADNSYGFFLGAGVNKPAGDVPVTYDTYTWPELLEELYKENYRGYDKLFDQMYVEHGDDWPGLAEALVGSLDEEIIVSQLDKIIYRCLPRGDTDSRLSKKMLDQAPSLQAAICFSTQIKERKPKSWTFKRNPRIGAVVTTNYDFFFGAGWTRYQAFKRQWKVHTATSENPLPEHGVIYHLHGYIPYNLKDKRELVLTTTSYRKYYASGKFARQKLEEVLKKYRLIFLGFSFQDPLVCDLLRQTETHNRHFAFIEVENAQLVSDLGICPVIFDEYADIPKMLEALYCETLSQETLHGYGFREPHEYWDRLKKGPR